MEEGSRCESGTVLATVTGERTRHATGRHAWEGRGSGDPGVRRPHPGAGTDDHSTKDGPTMAHAINPQDTTESIATERIAVPVWAWFLVALAAFLVYLMTMENGAVLGQLAEQSHEFFHDARHFIGFPCH